MYRHLTLYLKPIIILLYYNSIDNNVILYLVLCKTILENVRFTYILLYLLYISIYI